MSDYPWVNADGRKDAAAEDVDRAVRELWRAWGIAFIVILGITFI
jgi:adenosylcobinamide-phosphate synthase